MPRVYDRTDLYFTHRGDFLIGPEGDLYDTSDDPLRSFVQEIRTRLMSDLEDWRLYPEVGANLSSFIGEPNSKATAMSIRIKIIASLSQYGLVDTRDISISEMPLTADTLLFRLKINVAPTFENHNTESLKLQVLYNHTDMNLHVLF